MVSKEANCEITKPNRKVSSFFCLGSIFLIISLSIGISVGAVPVPTSTVWGIILSIVAAVNFLTEMTSNLATTAMLLPVLAALGLQMNIDPLILMIGATIAASCAFMLPVATPPNAIVFGAGYLRIPDMVEKGFRMNFISIIIITAMVYFLVPALLTFSIEG